MANYKVSGIFCIINYQTRETLPYAIVWKLFIMKCELA